MRQTRYPRFSFARAKKEPSSSTTGAGQFQLGNGMDETVAVMEHDLVLVDGKFSERWFLALPMQVRSIALAWPANCMLMR
jgi:hypothetical protein